MRRPAATAPPSASAADPERVASASAALGSRGGSVAGAPVLQGGSSRPYRHHPVVNGSSSTMGRTRSARTRRSSERPTSRKKFSSARLGQERHVDLDAVGGVGHLAVARERGLDRLVHGSLGQGGQLVVDALARRGVAPPARRVVRRRRGVQVLTGQGAVAVQAQQEGVAADGASRGAWDPVGHGHGRPPWPGMPRLQRSGRSRRGPGTIAPTRSRPLTPPGREPRPPAAPPGSGPTGRCRSRSRRSPPPAATAGRPPRRRAAGRGSSR